MHSEANISLRFMFVFLIKKCSEFLSTFCTHLQFGDVKILSNSALKKFSISLKQPSVCGNSPYIPVCMVDPTKIANIEAMAKK